MDNLLLIIRFIKRMTGFKKRLRDELGIRVFRFNSPCLLCGKNMRVAPGQIAYFHAECRTKGRELMRRAKV